MVKMIWMMLFAFYLAGCNDDTQTGFAETDVICTPERERERERERESYHFN